MTPSRSGIAEAYSALVKKGYFTEGIGGNEMFIGPLMLNHVPQDAQSILEVGGATGLWMRQVLQARRAIRDVTIVEFSDAAGECRRRLTPLLSGRPNPRLEVIQADFLQVAERLRPAQIVASSYVAEYMGDTPAYIRRLHDLTEPGGCVILLDVLTDPENTEGGVAFKVLLRSFALICQAYLRLGKVPPLCRAARCRRLYRIFQEPDFRALHNDYHAKYHFPRAAWMAERQRYPGAIFYDLGMIGLLILPKPG